MYRSVFDSVGEHIVAGAITEEGNSQERRAVTGATQLNLFEQVKLTMSKVEKRNKEIKIAYDTST